MRAKKRGHITIILNAATVIYINRKEYMEGLIAGLIIGYIAKTKKPDFITEKIEARRQEDIKNMLWNGIIK